MFFIIWGARSTIKDFGPIEEYLCSHCNNTNYWKLIRTLRWFTLFYIPIFPYEIKYFIICPICEYGINLDKSKFGDFKIIAENNNALINDTITSAQYVNNITKKKVSVLSSNNNVNKRSDINDDECINCNTKNIENTKFCKNCGLRL